MRKVLLAAAVSAAALLSSTGASAQSLVIDGPSGTFGNSQVTCEGGDTAPCSFSDELTFFTPSGYQLLNSTLSASETSDPLTTISFDTITLNGVSFDEIITGETDFYRLLNQVLIDGALNTIVVAGTTGGNAAYSGTLTFAAAVPEPGTWAMMLLGFGAIGFSMRRKRSQQALPQLA